MPFRATSIRWRSWRRGRSSSGRCATCSPAPAGAPGTSSISGTAFSLRRRWKPSRRSSSGCMAADGGGRVAVLLMAYGGPGSLDEVEPYLQDVRGGRPTAPELVQEIRQRYARIGGRSPIRELTEAQAAGVGQALAQDKRFAVYVRVAQALRRFPAPDTVHVLFTAHSLPERILATGDPYPDELRASAAAVAQRAGLTAWSFAYQSAGATPEPWLGPEAGAVMTELAGQGRGAFLIVPIGFVCDHVEVLYDVDVTYRELAGRLGVRLQRTTSLNDDPLLVRAPAEIARATAAARGWT